MCLNTSTLSSREKTIRNWTLYGAREANTWYLYYDDLLSCTCFTASYHILDFCMQIIKHQIHDEIMEEAHESLAVLQWHSNPIAWTYLLLLFTGNT
jgi:hypothetical protein